MSGNQECDKAREMQEYSLLHVLIDNIPYMLVGLLGAAILLWGIGFTMWGWITAAAFIAYTAGGTLWFIIFICPYCHFFGTRSCPCGYGVIAARFREKSEIEKFNEKFKQHIPVIFPLWIVPPVAGTIFLVRDFTWLMLILLLLFAFDAFVILPLVSRMYGCAHCPQKEDCPWMVKKTGSGQR